MKIIPIFDTEDQKLDDSEETLLAMLEDDDYFEEQIYKIRKICNIDESTFGDFSIEKVKNSFFHILNTALIIKNGSAKLKGEKNNTLIFAMKLWKEYSNLFHRSSWQLAIYFLIKYNRFYIMPTNNTFQTLSGKDLKLLLKNITRSPSANQGTYIWIRGKPNKISLIKYIKDHYEDEIVITFNKNHLLLSNPLNKNLPNLQIYRDILTMKKEKMNSQKIAEALNNKYKSNLMTDSKVRDMLSEYKKQIRDLRNEGKKK